MNRRVVWWLLFLSFPVSAYVPPPSHALRQWAEQVKSVQTLHVRQRTTFYDGSKVRAVVEEELWWKRPGYFKKVSNYPQGKLEVYVGKKAGKILDGKWETAPVPDLLGPLPLLFLAKDSRGMAALLRQAGVEASSARWTLSDRSVNYEIGNPAGDRVSFAKDDYWPVSAVRKGTSFAFRVPLPLRFGIPYPESIEVSEEGKKVEETEVLSVKVNPPLADSFFQPNIETKR